MRHEEAKALSDGDEIFILDGVGRISARNDSTFVAGPFIDGDGLKGKWVLLLRLPSGTLRLYNLTDLEVKPPVPKVGETWFHRVDGALRAKYVDGVTDRHVVLKSSSERPDDKAHIMTIADFVMDYRKKS